MANYLHMSANQTYNVSANPCKLTTLICNNAGATANTCTIYDNTSAAGTVVAIIDTTAAQMHGQTMTFNANMRTGLTIVLAAGTAADMTVMWE